MLLRWPRKELRLLKSPEAAPPAAPIQQGPLDNDHSGPLGNDHSDHVEPAPATPASGLADNSSDTGSEHADPEPTEQHAGNPDAPLRCPTCSQGHVKQDAMHVMMRFERVVKKKHGCYKKFMSRLRDAFFVCCQEDLELVKQSLSDRGYSPAQIEDEMKNNYKYFMR